MGFTLRCFQRLSLPYIATQRCSWQNNWYTSGKSTLVPRTREQILLKFPTPATDGDRTVSRRSELQLACRFNGRTAQPLGPTTAPGCDEPTSRVPNLPVDVNSWGDKPVIPKGSFYPLSDGPSIRNHRITKPDFRPCSSCSSRSQAPLIPLHSANDFQPF